MQALINPIASAAFFMLMLSDTVLPQQPEIVLSKIADAHGISNWNKVKRLFFTFNVDKEGDHFERKWIWEPKRNFITSVQNEDTISYASKEPQNSAFTEIDRQFINDKFWLLAPFQGVWNNNCKHILSPGVKAPISGKKLDKITVVYPSSGGYTPGDAYDYYYDDNFIIREWAYRKGNQSEPNLITTWEGYQNFEGLLLSTLHKRDKGDWKLYFTNVKVILN